MSLSCRKCSFEISSATINLYSAQYNKVHKNLHNLQHQFRMDVCPKSKKVLGRVYFIDTFKCCSHSRHDLPDKPKEVQHESYVM